jgi:hypothetical protein
MVHRYAALLPVVFFVEPLLAQTPFEFADQRTFDVGYTDCVAFPGGFAIWGWSFDDNGNSSTGFLRGIGMDGSALWETIPQQTEFEYLTEPTLTAFSDGTFLIAGGLFFCDVGGMYFLAERRDAAGNAIWSRYHAYPYLSDAAINAGDSIAYGTDSGILLTDAQGDSLTSFDTEPAYSNSIAWESGPVLLTASWGGQLARWASDGTQLASTTLSDNIADLLFWQGHRLALTSGGWLTAFNDDLQPLDNIYLGAGFAFGRLLPQEDQLLIVGNESTFTFDSALIQGGSIAMDPGGEFPADLFSSFAVQDSLLLMTATATTGGRPAGLARTVNLNGSHAPHVENVSIGIVSIDETGIELQNGLVYPQVDLTARITNLSSVPLENVMVCHFGYVGYMCDMNGTSVLIEDADLAPGDSLDVPMNGLVLAPTPIQGFNPLRPVCISALSPNDVYDRGQSDNYSCDTVQFPIGLAEMGMDAFGPVVGNPFDQIVSMFFSNPTKEPLRATLFDATGRPIATTTIATGSDRTSWDLPNVRDGVYVLRLGGGDTRISRTLIRHGQ